MNFRPCIVGRGRLARHLLHLFSLRGTPALHEADARTFTRIDPATTHLWLAVSDHALVSLRDRVRTLAPALPVLHSSAATRVPDATTLHPLMTFSHELYSRERYETVPWTTFSDEPAPPRIFERLQTLPAGERARYHAAAVMISNFSQLLWNAGEQLVPSLPREAWTPILEQTVTNFSAKGIAALTGPLVRGDRATVEAHRAALGGHGAALGGDSSATVEDSAASVNRPALALYDSFVRYYQETQT